MLLWFSSGFFFPQDLTEEQRQVPNHLLEKSQRLSNFASRVNFVKGTAAAATDVTTSTDTAHTTSAALAKETQNGVHHGVQNSCLRPVLEEKKASQKLTNDLGFGTESDHEEQMNHAASKLRCFHEAPDVENSLLEPLQWEPCSLKPVRTNTSFFLPPRSLKIRSYA